jgi:hypothetical protein
MQNVPGGKINILGSYGIGHSKQKLYIYACILFRTVSDIELFHCTVPNWGPYNLPSNWYRGPFPRDKAAGA